MSKEKQKHTNVQKDASELQWQLNDTVNQGISHPADVENCQIFTTTQPKRLATTHEHATRFREAIQAEDPQQLTVGTVPISEAQPPTSFGFQGEEQPLHDLIIAGAKQIEFNKTPKFMVTAGQIRSNWGPANPCVC